MPKMPITKELYSKLVDGFRLHGLNYAAVARHAGCDRRTSKRGWERGWPQRNEHWGPIRAKIEAELSATRAAQATIENKQDYSEAAERKKAQQDAIQARGQEAQLVRIARADVTQGLAAVARLMPGLQTWAQEAAEKFKTQKPKSIQEVTKMLESFSRIIERLSGAADKAMAMERRLLGEPEQIIGMQLPELTVSQSLDYIDAASRAVERARKSGLLPPAPEAAEESAPRYGNIPEDDDIIEAEVVEAAEG